MTGNDSGKIVLDQIIMEMEYKNRRGAFFYKTRHLKALS